MCMISCDINVDRHHCSIHGCNIVARSDGKSVEADLLRIGTNPPSSKVEQEKPRRATRKCFCCPTFSEGFSMCFTKL